MTDSNSKHVSYKNKKMPIESSISLEKKLDKPHFLVREKNSSNSSLEKKSGNPSSLNNNNTSSSLEKKSTFLQRNESKSHINQP
ncbi:MAG TPA: hypothetical protein VN704_08865, partial [Verrucomicrobiae bacterium]|nr:hypothetical protein [Verrucomicrobiae bacterium]